MEEIAANSILPLYGNKETKFNKAIDDIVNGKNTKAKQGLRKFIDFLNKIITEIKELLAGKTKAERAAIRAELNDIIKLRDMFESAFSKAVENVKSKQSEGIDTKAETKSTKETQVENGQKNTDTKDGVNFSIREE